MQKSEQIPTHILKMPDRNPVENFGPGNVFQILITNSCTLPLLITLREGAPFLSPFPVCTPKNHQVVTDLINKPISGCVCMANEKLQQAGQTEKFCLWRKLISCAKIFVTAKICAKFLSVEKLHRNCAKSAQITRKSRLICQLCSIVNCLQVHSIT